jgi:hypothetical protein
MVKFLDENQEVLETLRVSEKKSGGRGCEFKTNKCFCNLPIKKKKKMWVKDLARVPSVPMHWM